MKSRLFMALAALLFATSASAAANFVCKKTTSGSSGSGQKFTFHNTLKLSFTSATKASLKYYSNVDGTGNELEDAGLIISTGKNFGNHEDYVVFAGKDTVESGILNLAVPTNIFDQNDRFNVYFETVEDDTGSSKPVKFPLGRFVCVRDEGN